MSDGSGSVSRQELLEQLFAYLSAAGTSQEDLNRVREGILSQRRGDGGPPSFLRAFPSSRGSGKWGQIQRNLHEAVSSQDESSVISILVEISQTMAMESEESLLGQGLDVSEFTSDIATVLAVFGAEPALYACRILSVLVDIFPERVASQLKSCGAYDSLAARLVSVDSIEVTEESLQTLSHLVQIDPVSVLHSGCATNALQFLDFFAISTQKTALRLVVSAMAHADPRDLEERLMPAIPALVEAHRNTTDQDIAVQALQALAAITSIILVSPPSSKAVQDAKGVLFDDDSSFIKLVCDTLQNCCGCSKSSETSSAARTKMPFESQLTTLACDILTAACWIGGKKVRMLLYSLDIDSVLASAFQQCHILADDTPTSLSAGSSMDASLSSSGPSQARHVGVEYIEAVVGLIDSLVLIPASTPRISFRDIKDPNRLSQLSFVLKQEREQRVNGIISLITKKGGADKCVKFLSTSYTSLSRRIESADFSHRLLIATHRGLLRLCSLGFINENFLLFVLFLMLKQLYFTRPVAITELLTALPDDEKSVLGNDSYTSFIAKYLRSTSPHVQAFTILIIILILNRVRIGAKNEFIKDCVHDGTLAQLAHLSQSTSGEDGFSNELKTLVSVATTLIGSDCEQYNKESEMLREASEALLEVQDYDATVLSLKKLRDILISGKSGVSMYELIESNTIDNLFQFFVSVSDEGTEEECFDKKYSIICDRLRAFAVVFLDDAFLNPESSPSSAKASEHRSNGKSAVVLLIERLLECLSLSPSFKAFDFTPFFSSASKDLSGRTSKTQSMKLLSNSLQIRLRRDPAETTLSEESRDNFAIDAFAGVSAIEGFLLRLMGSELSRESQKLPLSEMPPVEFVTLERDKVNALSGHRLMFTMNGRLLDPDDTMVDIVRNSLDAKKLLESFSVSQTSKGDSHPLKKLWKNVYTINYRLVTEEAWLEAYKAKCEHHKYVPPVVIPVKYQSLPYFLATYHQPIEHAAALFDDTTRQALGLLDVLHHVNQQLRSFMYPDRSSLDSPILPRSVFVSRELSNAFKQQILDPIIQCWPDGVVRWAKSIAESRLRFLLSGELRKIYFRVKYTRLPRALTALHWDDEVMKRIAKPKTRFSLSRKSMLNSAVSLINTMSRTSELDVEYKGEAGIGLGPVLEYFSIVSHEVQQRSLDAFVDDSSAASDDTRQFVSNPSGLFPAIMSNPAEVVRLSSSQILEFTAVGDSPSYQQTVDKKQLFFFLGAFIATAIVDGRILDANFSRTFLKILVGDEPLSYEDMARSHTSLFRSLYPLVEAVRKGESTLSGMPIEDLALTMTVPGNSGVELVPNGTDVIVNGDTLPIYVEKLVSTVLSSGVKTPLECFNLGLRHILMFGDDNCCGPLSVFEPNELSELLSGEDERLPWDREVIVSSMALDHGFTRDSATIQNLVNLMVSFSGKQRRLFLLFVTGSPRLPVGGFPALSPKFQVSCKIPVKTGSCMESDSMLPSANCCFSLLKLPDYSTPDILRDRLLFAIENCQGSFDLS